MNRFIYSVLAVLIITFTLPFTAQAKSYTDARNVCLREAVACAIYQEARGESVKGQYAVAYVIHNRLNDVRFPNTLHGVVFQKSQFSWTKNRYAIRDKEAFERARKIAADVASKAKDPIAYRKADVTHGSLYFHNRSVRTSYFKKHSRNVARIGNHVFFGKVVYRKEIQDAIKLASTLAVPQSGNRFSHS